MKPGRDCSFEVPEDLDGLRADKGIAEFYEEFTRSRIAKVIKSGEVCINGKPCEVDTRIAQGDRISFSMPEDVIPQILPEDIPLDILYEDPDLLVVNKPKGMVVHPSPGHYHGTLVNALMHHCKDLSGINGVLRPGIVHRIDKDTTGALIVCKNDRAHQLIAAQLKEHSILRLYRAILVGNLKEEEGTVDMPIGRHPTERKKMAVNAPHAKRAVTHYRILERFPGFTYVECRLETGRTHQIRVHMTQIGHPLLGDPVYGSVKTKLKAEEGQMLHAYLSGFILPSTGEYLEVAAPLPKEFEAVLEKLRKM